MLKVTNLARRDARREKGPKQAHRSGDRYRHICELRNALCIEDGASHQRENRYFVKDQLSNFNHLYIKTAPPPRLANDDLK